MIIILENVNMATPGFGFFTGLTKLTDRIYSVHVSNPAGLSAGGGRRV
jgi:hypothetical protein